MSFFVVLHLEFLLGIEGYAKRETRLLSDEELERIQLHIDLDLRLCSCKEEY